MVSGTGALLPPLGRTVFARTGAGEDPVEQEAVAAGWGRDGAVLQPFCSEGWAAWGSAFLLTGSQGDDPGTAASVEISSFEVTCADS